MSRFAVLPFGYYATRRRDRLAISRVIVLMGLDPTSALGLDLRTALRARVSEGRDLFTQRGVCPRRGSVLRLAARSIREDRDLALPSEFLSAPRAAALLRAAAALLDRVGRLGYAACAQAAAVVARAPGGDSPAQVIPSPHATTDRQVAALRAVHRPADRAAPAADDQRFAPANSQTVAWAGPSVRLAA